LTVSFGEALLMAAWIVMQGVSWLVQLLMSFPVGATYRFAATAGAAVVNVTRIPERTQKR
jgi:hypothetical protein